jgi:hypothetical protein
LARGQAGIVVLNRFERANPYGAILPIYTLDLSSSEEPTSLDAQGGQAYGEAILGLITGPHR